MHTIARGSSVSQQLRHGSVSWLTFRSFVFRGLGSLTDHVFIHSARSIKVVNPAGVRKIRRDILALQQALRTVGSSPDEGVLARSVAYWDLYDLGPKVS